MNDRLKRANLRDEDDKRNVPRSNSKIRKKKETRRASSFWKKHTARLAKREISLAVAKQVVAATFAELSNQVKPKADAQRELHDRW